MKDMVIFQQDIEGKRIPVPGHPTKFIIEARIPRKDIDAYFVAKLATTGQMVKISEDIIEAHYGVHFVTTIKAGHAQDTSNN